MHTLTYINRCRYVYIAEGVFCLLVGIWALWRPFAVINPRPAAALLCFFWVPLYLICAGYINTSFLSQFSLVFSLIFSRFLVLALCCRCTAADGDVVEGVAWI